MKDSGATVDPLPAPRRVRSSPGHGNRAPAASAAPVGVADLAPNTRNPRKITDARLGALRRSLREFGDLSGIIFNEQTKRLVGGHQRVKIFQRDKGAQVVVSERLPAPDKWGSIAHGHVQLSDGNRFNYRLVYWTEERETAAMLAANAHGGEFETQQVNLLLSELDEGGFDIDLTGLALPSAGDGEGVGVSIKDKFEVVVECADEEEQQTVYDKLTEEGKTCRLLTF